MSHLNAICLLSSKSGVGKTFLSLHLAYLMAKCKSRVLLIDFDFMAAGLSDFFCLHKPQTSHEWKEAESFVLKIIQKKMELEEFQKILKSSHNLIREYDFIEKEIHDYLSFIPCVIQEIPDFVCGITLSVNLMAFLVTAQKMGYEYVFFDCASGYRSLCSRASFFSNTLVFVSEYDRISEKSINRLKNQIFHEEKNTLECIEKIANTDVFLQNLLKDWQRFVKIENQQKIFIFNRCYPEDQNEKKNIQNQSFIINEKDVAACYNKGCLVFPPGLIDSQRIAIEQNRSLYVQSVLGIYKQIAERYGHCLEGLDLGESHPLLSPQEELEIPCEEEIISPDAELQMLRMQSQEILEEYQSVKEKYEELLARNHSLEQESQKYQEDLERALHNHKETTQECESIQKEYQRLYESHQSLIEKHEQLKKKQDLFSIPSSSSSIPKLEPKEGLEVQKIRKEYQSLQEEYIAQTMAYHDLEQEYNRVVVELNAWKDKLYEIKENHGTQKLVRDVLSELEKISFKQ